MTKIAVTEWRKIRASCAEGSGVAEAIKAYDGKWPTDYSKANEKDLAAFKASENLVKALDVALGKCNKAGPKVDKVKVKATKDLIDEWKTELSSRVENLRIAFEVRQKELAADINEARLVTKVQQNYAGIPDELKTVETRLADITKLINAGKIEEAFRMHGRVAFTLKTVAKSLTEAGLKEKFESACQDLKIAPGGTRAADCRPKEFKAWRQKLDGLRTQTEAKEKDLDKVEAGADPDTAQGDPTYKSNLKKLTGEYRNVQKMVASCIPMIDKLTTQAKQMQAAAPGLTPDKKPTALATVKTVRDRVAAFEKNMMIQMAKIRTNDGEVSAKRAQYKINPDDTTKFLAPILSQAISQNLRATRGCGDATEILDEVEKQLAAA